MALLILFGLIHQSFGLIYARYGHGVSLIRARKGHLARVQSPKGIATLDGVSLIQSPSGIAIARSISLRSMPFGHRSSISCEPVRVPLDRGSSVARWIEMERSEMEMLWIEYPSILWIDLCPLNFHGVSFIFYTPNSKIYL
jgi:hypothetical protein